MGLDMYAYVAKKENEMREYYESYDYTTDSAPVPKPREIAYWRKHPNLHGWMHRLWNEKGHSGDFNGDELELTAEDLDRLEHVVEKGRLPSTTGFFFGNDADDHYKADDLKFIQYARAELIVGMKVFYNSSW
jgi:hypothetical protein